MDHYQVARNEFTLWEEQLKENLLLSDSCLMHTYQCYFANDQDYLRQLKEFAVIVANQLEPIVMENNLDANLPKVEHYTPFGFRHDKVNHHPTYIEAGNLIYGSELMKYLLQAGQMKKTLGLFLLSSHAGEAGHNCPIACSAGVMRILSKHSSLPQTQHYLDKLIKPSFADNYTGAQFLTEIQGGSDVGANATQAFQDASGQWRIKGEKWFCSNANADLILMTARFDETIAGTKGLGLFLVPAKLENNQPNLYKIRRLKQKIGTRSMATGEIDFEGAVAYPMGNVADGIHLVMENVLHLSRVFNSFSVMGMARRAHQIASYYACNRQAFNQPVTDFPLVKEALALIRAENIAMMASIFYLAQCQDEQDRQQSRPRQLLLRTLANINKYYTAKRSVENIHHCLDILAGNGTIESFSSLPRLLRDCIVCENWEGTHFTLWMQTLKDIHKFAVDELFLAYAKTLLETIDTNSPHKTALHDKIDALAANFAQLKGLPEQEQSLRIRDIVEEMAVVNAALTLALEAQTGQAPKAKHAALALYLQKNVTKEKMLFERYLGLLNDLSISAQ